MPFSSPNYRYMAWGEALVRVDWAGGHPTVSLLDDDLSTYVALDSPRSEDIDMRWSGEFVSAGHYFFGDVVRAGTSAYVCKLSPPQSVDARYDTFVRADQADFGTASDGHAWEVVYRAAAGMDSISANMGLAQCFGAGNSDDLRCGGDMAAADVELLVRWEVATSIATNDGVMLCGGITADGTIRALVQVTLDGDVRLQVASASHTAAGAWAGSTAGQKVWTRARLEAGTWSVRSWLDGATEPNGWDVVWASGQTVTPSGVGLACADSNAGSVLGCDHFEATTLSAVTRWPGFDADHWDLLAGA